MHAVLSDPRAMAYWSSLPHDDVAQTRDWLSSMIAIPPSEGEDFVVNGEKLFITNAIPGRTVGLVVMLEGKPAVLIAELPREENEHFQLNRYGIYALRQAYNNGLRFHQFRVPRVNLLKPTLGDGLTIAYHGLNLGRLSLCAGAAGSMRVPSPAAGMTVLRMEATGELMLRR